MTRSMTSQWGLPDGHKGAGTPPPTAAPEPEGALLRPRSPQMAALLERVGRVARADFAAVLLSGETGVGKEWVSHLIHELSPRKSQPFLALNCANLDRALLQSELFGHERGAFTGASERRRGLFELADRGTLLLDEVGEMPLGVQAAFLRVLECHRFRRLGGSSELESRARLIAATNQDLRSLVRAGRFRADLFYRLHALELRVPPLRERPEDIRLLAEHFCHLAATRVGGEARLSEGALAHLLAHPWPGNVRELKHVIERAVVLQEEGTIEACDLLLEPRGVIEGESPAPPPPSPPRLAEVELRHIREILRRCEGNKTRAAQLLGISRNTLARKLAAARAHSESAPLQAPPGAGR